MADRTDDGNPHRRRRRIRQSPGRTGNQARTGNQPRRRSAAVAEPPAPPLDTVTGATGLDRETERGLRGLVGAGTSQLSISAALRARDAARPRRADLTEAEERLVLVRRNWVPREDRA